MGKGKLVDRTKESGMFTSNSDSVKQDSKETLSLAILRRRETTDMLKNDKLGNTVAVAGYIKSIKKVGDSLSFIVLSDQYGDIQLTCKKDKIKRLSDIQNLTRHTFIAAMGNLIEGRAKGGREIEVKELVSLTTKPAPPLPIELNDYINTGLEKRIDYRWIDLRDQQHRIPIVILSELTKYMSEFLWQNRFTQIFSPKFTGYPTEGGAEAFPVEYFGRKAYLVQSPQFYKQMAICSGLERVFEVTPVFRAEPSFTSRHNTEFTSFDIELGYITSENDVMALEENLLNYAFQKLIENHSDQIEMVTKEPIQLPRKIPKIKMEEAWSVVSKTSVSETGDLTSEGEKEIAKYIKEKTGSDFVFTTDWPFAARPFYHMLGTPTSDGRPTTRSFDLIYRGVEITTGAQREHNYDKLLENVKAKGLNQENLQYYLNFFKYGAPPHGGLGLGISRVVTQMLNLGNIREAILLPRDLKRLGP